MGDPRKGSEEDRARRDRTAGTKLKLEESRLLTEDWMRFEKAMKRVYGRDTGKEMVRMLQIAEFDFEVWCTYFLGIRPFPWQSWVWDEFRSKPYGVAMLGNSGGKSESHGLFYLTAGFWRSWSPDWWGQYRMIHLAPQEQHATEVESKMHQILLSRSRAQRIEHKNGTSDYRPCLIAPFIERVKHDDGEHLGYDFFGGSSILTFRSSAFKAKGTDGVDPYYIGFDEVRHEANLNYIVENIIMPRFLRVPNGHFYMPFTPLEASPDAVDLYNRGATGVDPDWFAMNAELRDANPTLRDEDIERLKRNVSKRLVKQIISGRPTQPADAVFSQEIIEHSFIGVTEPEDFDVLEGLRARTMARCPSCRSKKDGKPGFQFHEHLMIGALDPASSSESADDIVYKVWDLEPFFDGRINDPTVPITVYTKTAEPGTEECRIQNVAKHLGAVSKEIQGPCGYDRKSPLGHNVKDNLLDVDGEFIELASTTAEMKNAWIDFLKGLTDRGMWRSYYHARTKAQMLGYKRKDKGIRTDYVMCEVMCAEVAKPFLPLSIVDPVLDKGFDEERRHYLGTGDSYDPFAAAAEANGEYIWQDDPLTSVAG